VVVLFRHGELRKARQELGLPCEGALSPEAVDRAVAGGREDPGGRVLRASALRPPLERRGERVLDGVLGPLEVAQETSEDGDGTTPFVAEDALDVGYSSASLTILRRPRACA
jgi:hypothetical protein